MKNWTLKTARKAVDEKLRQLENSYFKYFSSRQKVLALTIEEGERREAYLRRAKDLEIASRILINEKQYEACVGTRFSAKDTKSFLLPYVHEKYLLTFMDSLDKQIKSYHTYFHTPQINTIAKNLLSLLITLKTDPTLQPQKD